MFSAHPHQRVAVLADSQNLYHTAQNRFQSNIDYSALLERAINDRRLIRAIAYVIRAEAPEEESFFEALNDIGYETKIKDIRRFSDGSKKADWDIGMCLDAITLANHVDVIVLCTGDGDFSRLCSHLRHAGTRVEVMSFESSTAEALIREADVFYDLSEDLDRYLL